MFQLLDHALTRSIGLFLGLLIAFPWSFYGLFTQGLSLAISACLIAYGLMPYVIALAHKVGALDVPDARRVHATTTPRIGGVSVILALNITLFLNLNYSIELKGVCLSALIVGFLSFWDDIHELSAAVKLLGQFSALAILMAAGVHINFAPDIWWGYGLEYIVTALWIIGITNAFNFLDGINGLAASLAALTCLLMSLLAWHTGQIYMLFLCLALAGAAIGFLPDNARYKMPARSFLGDVGSTYLGWMMAAIAVMGDWSSEGAIKAYAAPLLIFSVMVFDMIHTTVARIQRGDVHNVREWIEYVGRDHLHHRLMALGCSQKQAVTIILGFSCMVGLAALALVKSPILSVWLLLGQSLVFYGILTILMGRAARK